VGRKGKIGKKKKTTKLSGVAIWHGEEGRKKPLTKEGGGQTIAGIDKASRGVF